MRVDEVAIGEFLHTSYPRLVAAVALTSGSRPAAEDAVQEALIRAWERSDKGEEIASLEGWVATVALNLARSGLRGSGPSVERGLGCTRQRSASRRRPIASTSIGPWRRSRGANGTWRCSGTTCS
jgi:DNA-directed RNA polymerase specialized sigma24 family protein